VADKDIKYTDEVIRTIALKVAKDFLEDTTEMRAHMFLEVVEALDRGEDVYDNLLSTALPRPFVERLINELLEYKE